MWHPQEIVEAYVAGRWRSSFQILTTEDADRARYLTEILPRLYRLRPQAA